VLFRSISPEKIKYNTSKPSGQFRKPAKTDILEDFKFTPLEEGINKTIDWFIENYDTARK
jgi:GDP-L-fucose synthase